MGQPHLYELAVKALRRLRETPQILKGFFGIHLSPYIRS
jgi:hypothetical protein